MKGVSVIADPTEVQAIATELTVAEYLKVVLLLDTKGGSMLGSPYVSEEEEDAS